MKTHQISLMALLVAGLWACAAALQAEDRIGNSEASNLGDGASASLMEVDRHLLDGLRAESEPARLSALRAAQAVLDAMTVEPVAGTEKARTKAEDAPWLEETESSLDRLHTQVHRDLRQSLAGKIWISPYGAGSDGSLGAIETISDALHLVREIKRLGSGDGESLEGISRTYWAAMTAHREQNGLQYIVAEGDETGQVYEQRVMAGKDGGIEIYQLTGTEEGTLRWTLRPVQPLPEDLLASGALVVDLSRETAEWLLVLEGEGLAGLLVANQHWLESIGGQARLALLIQGDYANEFQNILPAWQSNGPRIPYYLPAASRTGVARVHLVHVKTAALIATWPAKHLLGGTEGLFLKKWISTILAASGRN